MAELAWPGNTGTPTDYLLDLVSDDGPAIDLGDGHFARFFVEGDDSGFVKQGDTRPPDGFFHVHPSKGQGRTPEGDPCAGSVTFGRWTLISLDPLHVEPSILCSCGCHGFVRAGRWEE